MCEPTDVVTLVDTVHFAFTIVKEANMGEPVSVLQNTVRCVNRTPCPLQQHRVATRLRNLFQTGKLPRAERPRVERVWVEPQHDDGQPFRTVE